MRGSETAFQATGSLHATGLRAVGRLRAMGRGA
jgi:hypothetical protein